MRPAPIECPICGRIWKKATDRIINGQTCTKRCASIKGYLSGNHKETGIELKLQEMLLELNIPFITQKPLLGITVADIVVEPNVVLFADGEYWHSKPKQEYKDQEIAKKLEKSGYLVLRLSEEEINDDIESVQKKFLNVYERRRINKQL